MMTQKKIQSEKKVQLLLFCVHNYTCMHAMILDKLHDIKVKITNEALYFEQQVWWYKEKAEKNSRVPSGLAPIARIQTSCLVSNLTCIVFLSGFLLEKKMVTTRPLSRQRNISTSDPIVDIFHFCYNNALQ